MKYFHIKSVEMHKYFIAACHLKIWLGWKQWEVFFQFIFVSELQILKHTTFTSSSSWFFFVSLFWLCLHWC